MVPTTTIPYRDDLAYIHDAGFGHVAQNAAVELVRRLSQLPKDRRSGVQVVDSGCGSGILAQAVSAAGYSVLGFDLSDSMLALAAKRSPQAEFRHESFISADLPQCVAITAIGEVFNYLFDRRNRGEQLSGVIGRAYEALCPGGLFLFDVAEPGRVRGSGPQRGYAEGPGWACLYTAEEDHRRQRLTRTITTFRRFGESYCREHEVHRLRLYHRSDVLKQLRSAGFQARTLRGYARFRFPEGWVGFLARKGLR
jgi:SAM-dependent methyltransferase